MADEFKKNSKDKKQFNLARFKTAQDPVYHKVVAELSQGRKNSHWMWFIFPQLKGLGQSAIAKEYGLDGAEEAKAFLQDNLLFGRLNECCQILCQLEGKSANAILGYPDELKLCSSMTLFASVSDVQSIFHQVLNKYYNDKQDLLTLSLLKE